MRGLGGLIVMCFSNVMTFDPVNLVRDRATTYSNLSDDVGLEGTGTWRNREL